MLVGLNDRDAEWHDVYEIDIVTGERKLVLQNRGRASSASPSDLSSCRASRPARSRRRRDLYAARELDGWERVLDGRPGRQR